tara:strand:+ start:74144 stop:75028 length:885 start_codon:yes stop_codon:yes gene_type:complete
MLLSCALPAASEAESARNAAAPPSLPSVSPVAPGSRAIAERSDFILIGEARQGGLMRGTVPKGTRALRFDDVEIPVDKDGQFVIAFDRDAPETATLRAELKGGAFIERLLTIQPGNWRIEHVNASMTAGVPSAEFRRRRAVELERIHAARSIHSDSDGWRQNFRWPIVGRISGLFGSQRIYRGTPGSYHSGVDIAAGTGAAFVAPADGVVILAAEEPFTLEGHLLMIDHGMGLNSAFLHCSSLFVKEGDVVRQGQTLGTVGATGRATGPHLHWGMKWNAARLDPKMIAGPMPEK